MNPKADLAVSDSAPVGVLPSGETPRYKHGCTHCVFLGRMTSSYGGDGPRQYDLYYHPGDDIAETVIARFGRASLYFSGMAFAKPYTDIDGVQHEGIPMLVEALARAALRRAQGETA